MKFILRMESNIMSEIIVGVCCAVLILNKVFDVHGENSEYCEGKCIDEKVVEL